MQVVERIEQLLVLAVELLDSHAKSGVVPFDI